VTPVRRAITRRHPIAVVLSLLAHAAFVLVLLLVVAPAPAPVEPPPVNVSLAPGINRSAAPGEAAPAAPTKAAATAPEPKSPVRKTRIPPPPEIEAVTSGNARTLSPVTEVTAAELAGAATAEGAGSGGAGGSGAGAGGGACNMVRRIQEALRRDQLVLAAANTPAAAGKAVRVWNGDWVQSTGEDGKGLAAVREAIMWEVAFAPASCRAQPVHGLVLISLNDGAGATRLALGTSDWRWSDLLGLQGVRR
jgi:hypothetical protein